MFVTHFYVPQSFSNDMVSRELIATSSCTRPWNAHASMVYLRLFLASSSLDSRLNSGKLEFLR
jgi:hypothetical protein